MMSAEPYEFTWSLLKAMSRRIVNEVDGIARVVYDTTSKPPGECPYANFFLLRIIILTEDNRHNRTGVMSLLVGFRDWVQNYLFRSLCRGKGGQVVFQTGF